MRLICFDKEEKYIRMFLALPGKLYSEQEIMQDKEQEKALLYGTHYLNRYVKLKKFLVEENGHVAARCVVTEYPDDSAAYFGFFECVDDIKIFDCLMDGVQACVMADQYTVLEGPLDVSLWIRYRFKTNHFELPPYLGEPYNKAYYTEFFSARGYGVKQTYVSNRFGVIPEENFAIKAYEEKYEQFTKNGYEIRSVRLQEWDQAISDIYDMICVLYRNFLTYHEITREEFIQSYNSLKSAIDPDMIKLVFYRGKAVGFFVSAPNYGNLSSRKKTLSVIWEYMKIKRKPREYVMLYMGVMPEHKGAGLALTHSIMAELAKKGTPSIGSLIREGNPNFEYGKEYLTGRYTYDYLEKYFTIQDYIKRGERLWKDKPYICDESGSWHTFGEFASDVKKCACWMLHEGYENLNIGIYGKNSYLWMVLDMSIMGYTGTSVPVDMQYKEDEVANILHASSIRVLFYDPSMKDRIKMLEKAFPEVVMISMEKAAACFKKYETAEKFSLRKADATAKIIYTSGTSDRPKGVMLSQKNMFANWKTLFKRTPMTAEDRIYLVLPLNHIYAGVAAFLYTLVSGMEICLGKIETDECLMEMKKYRPTVFIGVPLLAERFWSAIGEKKHPAEELGGKLKYFYCGGAFIRPELKMSYIEAGIPMYEAYGLTETSSVAALDIPGQYKSGSVGVLMESIEALILNPDEEGVGEILIRGNSVMSGYAGMPELTSEVLDEKGYFHTGDLGRIDESRHLYLKGRNRRLLLTGNGKNVYPQEVEELACKNPMIVKALLYVENDRLHLKAWYNGKREDAEKYLEDLRTSLPGYMRYEDWSLTEDTPEGRIK